MTEFLKWVVLCARPSWGVRPSTIVFLCALAACHPASRLIGEDPIHWAFKPVERPAPPSVEHSAWARNPIDVFILAKLEANQMAPSPPADRRTLVRRAYFDLTGLPPSYEAVQAFANDDSPDAFSRVVDRLLDSPQYGERWGRHWLDVARYAETKDLVLLYGKDRLRPYAYTYRDYVIRAFNEDLPFGSFVRDQLAADQTAPASERWRLAGMGFLTLGRLFDKNLPDIYDDRIDVTTRGFLGLTVSCARCHDHKYDPIPMEDYYSLYGVFSNSEYPLDPPLIRPGEQGAEAKAFLEKWSAKRGELQKHLDEQYRHLTAMARERVGDYLLKVATEPPGPLENVVFFLSLSPEDLRPQWIAKWRRYLNSSEREEDPVFGLWHDLAKLEAEKFKEAAPRILQSWMQRSPGYGKGRIHPWVRELFEGHESTSMKELAEAYARLFDRARREEGSDADHITNILTSPDGPVYFPKSATYPYMARVERTQYDQLVLELDKLAVHSEHAPARAMILKDMEVIEEPRVFVRGNPRQPGEQVPRRFLKVFSSGERTAFKNGSGREELAGAIASPGNPLTGRVIANRVWMHHFGAPLVSSPNDFGTRADPPTHPGLLDYLAWTFWENGGSVKSLHRRIMLSNAYRQSSRDRPECRQRDPDNRFLWRANRRRLDFESMRDSMLAVSGRLSLEQEGKSVYLTEDETLRRRAIYGVVDRQDLPAVYRAFDFANPDQCAARRTLTIVPQQALFAMNSEFVLLQAGSLAESPEFMSLDSTSEKIAFLYRRIFGRKPSAKEFESGERYIAAEFKTPEKDTGRSFAPWPRYIQVLLQTNEFMFID